MRSRLGVLARISHCNRVDGSILSRLCKLGVPMSNCRGCGTLLDPTESESNQGINKILEAPRAIKPGQICPICGHSKAQPISQRKSVQFGLFLAVLLIGSGLAVTYRMRRNTERHAAAQ